MTSGERRVDHPIAELAIEQLGPGEDGKAVLVEGGREALLDALDAAAAAGELQPAAHSLAFFAYFIETEHDSPVAARAVWELLGALPQIAEKHGVTIPEGVDDTVRMKKTRQALGLDDGARTETKPEGAMSLLELRKSRPK